MTSRVETDACHRCHGAGFVGPVHCNRGDEPHEWIDRMQCDVCGGGGELTPDQVMARTAGAAMRRARVDRGESLLEASKRLGMSPAQLSAIESGRRPVSAQKDKAE